MANEELIALIFTAEGGIPLSSLEYEFKDTYGLALSLEGERDVLSLIERNYSRDVRVVSRQCLRQQVLYAAPRPSSELLRGFSGVENGSIPYSNQVSEDSSKTKWARSGPPWTILITSLGFCSQNALESGYLKFYSSWSGIHKPRFQKENKKCTFFARFENMQQADDLKVYLHRLKDAQLRVQFVTSYALPNQKEIKARQSGNCNYYKDESGARFQRFPNQEQNQIFYLKRPETKESEKNVPSIQKLKIPRDMRENRNCLVNLKSEETAGLCLPCSELGVPVIRQQELRGAGEHDLIPWQKMPDELRLEIPPEDFLVEITAPPFVDFDQQECVLEDVPLRIHCKLVNSLFVVRKIQKQEGVLLKNLKSGDTGWARGENHEHLKFVCVFNLNSGKEESWKRELVENTETFAGIPAQTLTVEVGKNYKMRAAPKVGEDVLFRNIDGNERRKEKRFIFAPKSSL